MPFVALAKNGSADWKRVDITTYQTPKQDLNGYELKCQICDAPMYIRHTIQVEAHFAHKPGQERDCAYNHTGESESHRAAKREIAQRIRGHHAYAGARIEYEVHLKQINRIADILVIFPDGSGEIHETQLAAISTDDLDARTKDYRRLGYDVVWWLGKNADTETNRQWTKTNFGYSAILSISEHYQSVSI